MREQREDPAPRAARPAPLPDRRDAIALIVGIIVGTLRRGDRDYAERGECCRPE